MTYFFYRVMDEAVFREARSLWPAINEGGILKEQPRWNAQFFKGPHGEEIIPDATTRELDLLVPLLTGNKAHFCLSAWTYNCYRFYIAAPHDNVERQTAPTLRDSRLGPRVRGFADKICIIVSADAADRQAGALSPSSSLTAKPTYLKKFKQYLTFGGTSSAKSGKETEVDRRPSREESERREKTVDLLRKKIIRRRGLLVHDGMHMLIRGNSVLISRVSIPAPTFTSTQEFDATTCGIALANTEVVADQDDQGEFRTFHICPFLDTLVDSYEVDYMTDIVAPYLKRNPLERFAEGDILQVRDVQFKVIRTDPPSLPLRLPLDSVLGLESPQVIAMIPPNLRRKRVGQSTDVCIGHAIVPHWVDVLPEAQHHIIFSLPQPVQSMLLFQFVLQLNAEQIIRVHNANELIRTSQGVPQSLLKTRVDWLLTLKVDKDALGPDDVCTICFTQSMTDGLEGEELDIKPNMDVMVRLECTHLFHVGCILSWIAKSRMCPVCKQEIVGAAQGLNS